VKRGEALKYKDVPSLWTTRDTLPGPCAACNLPFGTVFLHSRETPPDMAFWWS